MGLEPLVCAVMITNNRPQMAGRAVRCFNRQTYRNKLLFVLDTTPEKAGQAATEWMPELNGKSIGALRNLANASAIHRYEPDILINWDDDDWSHPNRIASQVESLLSVKVGAVGYRDLLWWDSTTGEAWMFTHAIQHYCLGTSLCYWPATWKASPFPDPKLVGGHDTGEWNHVNQQGFGSMENGAPMIIGEYHGNNGACRIKPDNPDSWQRVPEWDGFCRKTMNLGH